MNKENDNSELRTAFVPEDDRSNDNGKPPIKKEIINDDGTSKSFYEQENNRSNISMPQKIAIRNNSARNAIIIILVAFTILGAGISAIGMIGFMILRDNIAVADVGSEAITNISVIGTNIQPTEAIQTTTRETDIVKSFSVNGIDEIDISVMAVNVYIFEEAHSDTITVQWIGDADKCEPSISVVDNVLKIDTFDAEVVRLEECRMGKKYTDIKISLPSHVELTRIQSQTVSGGISIQNINIETELIIESASGSHELFNSSFTYAVINTASGGVNVKDVEIASIDMNTASVSVNVKDVEIGNMDISTASGRINVKDSEIADLQIATATGYVSVDFINFDTMDISSATGSADVTVYTESDIEKINFSSVLGEIRYTH